MGYLASGNPKNGVQHHPFRSILIAHDSFHGSGSIFRLAKTHNFLPVYGSKEYGTLLFTPIEKSLGWMFIPGRDPQVWCFIAFDPSPFQGNMYNGNQGF